MEQQRFERGNRGQDCWYSEIALGAGIFVAGMGLLAWWSFSYLGYDEFNLFLTMWVVSSFLAWPTALLSACLSVLLIRNGHHPSPWPAISLCCFGITIIVFTWIAW